jgi:hypothetical protein
MIDDFLSLISYNTKCFSNLLLLLCHLRLFARILASRLIIHILDSIFIIIMNLSLIL